MTTATLTGRQLAVLNTATRQPLTDRQREVIGYVANGWTQDEIAERLQISRVAVGRIMTRAMSALGAWNTAHAVAQAFRTGELEVVAA